MVFSVWLMYAIGSQDNVLNNQWVKYLSSVSMEVYLCHMMFFRVVEKLHLETIITDGDCLYVVTVCMVLIGAIVFSHLVKFYVFPYVERLLKGL